MRGRTGTTAGNSVEPSAVSVRVRTASAAAVVTLVIHLAANPHYGFFRDELYFIICGFHPAVGLRRSAAGRAAACGGHATLRSFAVCAAHRSGGFRSRGRLRHRTARLRIGGGIFASALRSACVSRCRRADELRCESGARRWSGLWTMAARGTLRRADRQRGAILAVARRRRRDRHRTRKQV